MTKHVAFTFPAVVQIPNSRLERADDRSGPDFLTASPDVLVETRVPRRRRPALAI